MSVLTTVSCLFFHLTSFHMTDVKASLQGIFLCPDTHLCYLTKPVMAMWSCFGVVQWMVSDWVWGKLCESTRLGQAYKNKPPHPKLNMSENTRSCRETNACVCACYSVKKKKEEEEDYIFQDVIYTTVCLDWKRAREAARASLCTLSYNTSVYGYYSGAV